VSVEDRIWAASGIPYRETSVRSWASDSKMSKSRAKVTEVQLSFLSSQQSVDDEWHFAPYLRLYDPRTDKHLQVRLTEENAAELWMHLEGLRTAEKTRLPFKNALNRVTE